LSSQVDGYNLDHPSLPGLQVDRTVNIDPLTLTRPFGSLTRMETLKGLRKIRDAGIGLFVQIQGIRHGHLAEPHSHH
jgi:hypothetical protein